jgi:hypothetical protein
VELRSQQLVLGRLSCSLQIVSRLVRNPNEDVGRIGARHSLYFIEKERTVTTV